MDFTFTPHALEQMQKRSIPLQTVLTVLDTPEQTIPVEHDRSAYQSKVQMSDGEYLLQLIVEPDGTVVTIYLTSRIEKYWSEES
jgi:hypothetical protein